MLQEITITTITAVVGPVVVILVNHYLQKKRTSTKYSQRTAAEIQARDRPRTDALEPARAEERTYYNQRVAHIYQLAEERSSGIERARAMAGLIPLALAILIGVASQNLGNGFITLFGGAFLGMLGHLYEIFDAKRCLGNEIRLSKLDRSALFELRERVQNGKKINSEVEGRITKTIERELKSLVS